MNEKPLLTVVAGPQGAGKSTVIRTLRSEAWFPALHAIEHEMQAQVFSEILQAALLTKQPLVIETRLDSPTVLHAMDFALERGFSVELVLVDVDDVEMLLARLDTSCTQLREALARYRHHVPGAVDLAKRVLLIDNSAAQPLVSELRAPGGTPAQLSGPRWFSDKVITPQLLRAASRQALRHAAVKGPLQPIVQAARASSGPTAGLLVEVTKHHALQQVGQALHLIHDLAMLPLGGPVLVAGVVALLAYQAEASRSPDRDRAPGPASPDARSDREGRKQREWER
jgi:predicted ABC-type ATPase